MSDSSIIPLPKARDIWAADHGWLFFLKWMIFALFAAALKAAYAILDPYGLGPSPVLTLNFHVALLWLSTPILIQAWPLFGLRWRLWAWVIASVRASFINASAEICAVSFWMLRRATPTGLPCR